MSYRPASRIFTNFRPVFRQPLLRRRVQTAANPAEAEAFSISKFWNSKVGPKTVHFWAPVMKWCIVLSGVADFARPASQLSLTQNAALTTTGAIWTRWCFVIRPKNMFLAAVNFFLFAVGATQVTRILSYQRSVKNASEEAKVEGKEIGQGLKEGLESAKKEAEKIVKS